MMLAALSFLGVVCPLVFPVLAAHYLLWRQPQRISNHIMAVGLAVVWGMVIQIARGGL